MVPATTRGLVLNPAPAPVEAAYERTREESARGAAVPPVPLEQRLRELDHEWDAEHVAALTSGLALIGSVELVSLLGEGWLALPALIGACLVLQGLFGWTPGLTLLRRLGLRTCRGIAHERSAVQAMRGDFGVGSPVTTPQERADLSRFENEGGPAATLAAAPARDSAADDARLHDARR